MIQREQPHTRPSRPLLVLSTTGEWSIETASGLYVSADWSSGTASSAAATISGVELHLPNSAFLGNIETFVSKARAEDPSKLRLTFNPRWVAIHPAVLAMVACASALVRSQDGVVEAEVPDIRSLPYLIRMKLFDHLGIDPGYFQEHEAAGRFIPLTQIRTKEDLSRFIVDMIPLLHAKPAEVGPIKYVMSELIRNVLEHAASPVGALVCAQYFKDSDRLAVGVADAGAGHPWLDENVSPCEEFFGGNYLGLEARRYRHDKPLGWNRVQRRGGAVLRQGNRLCIPKLLRCL